MRAWAEGTVGRQCGHPETSASPTHGEGELEAGPPSHARVGHRPAFIPLPWTPLSLRQPDTLTGGVT